MIKTQEDRNHNDNQKELRALNIAKVFCLPDIDIEDLKAVNC